MRISSLEEYGLRCLLALAREGCEGQLSITDIAEMEGLSVPYTSKLLSILRKSDLVSAVRGRKGGFCIKRKPGEITLLEVITALGGPLINPDHCSRFSGKLDTCVHVDNCSVHGVLDTLAGTIEHFLSKTTLQDLIEQGNRQTGFTTAETLLTSEIQDTTKEINTLDYKERL